MAERQSDFIPNSFQTPNIYVDAYLHLLTGEEWKVLSYAIRRILGFHKTSDRISLSQFAYGIRSRDGRQLDHGCGVSVDTVRVVLKNLCRYGFLMRVSENDPKLNTGPEYALQLDDSRINMSAILSRKHTLKDKNKVRTLRARRVVTSRRKQYPLLSDTTTPLLSDTMPPPIVGQEHNIQENQGKPEYIAAGEKIPTLEEIVNMTVVQVRNLPEMKLYERVTKHFPGQDQWGFIIEFIRSHNLTEAIMLPCWTEWRVKRGYRAENLGWLDWCVNGIEERKNGNHKSGNKKGTGTGRGRSGSPASTASDSDIERARAIVAKRGG